MNAYGISTYVFVSIFLTHGRWLLKLTHPKKSLRDMEADISES